jgi:GABA permease
MNAAPPSAVQSRVERLLAVANETLAGDEVIGAIRGIVAPDARIYVICPALVSRTRFWTSDLTAGIASAYSRLSASLASMRALGLNVDAIVGDADPLLAIEDALRVFDADHLLISTHPADRSTWLERRVVERARARFAPPVTHVVVDLRAGLAETPGAQRALAAL